VPLLIHFFVAIALAMKTASAFCGEYAGNIALQLQRNRNEVVAGLHLPQKLQ